MTLVRGLSVDRENNSKEDDYHVYVDIEDMGLVVYTPKYLQNADNFVFKEKTEDIYTESR